MPHRSDLKKIFIIGAGPIIIGQACEFDYSGTQACKSLKELGYKIILINSNPATIMTDAETADVVYIEPITPETVRKIILKENPDAILPTLGGQTALNITVEAGKDNFFEKQGVEVIGANLESIHKAEDRKIFKNIIDDLGYETTRAIPVNNYEFALEVVKSFQFPVIVRSSFTLGGTGGSIAYNIEEYREMVKKGIDSSPINEVTVEESILGWKEYELEVMKDTNDNVVIICSIENFDPVGIHTGDSITVAPQQTLSDKEYQKLRDMSIAIIREIGVSTGGANIQFAVHPETGRIIVIEMNPRVSRSSSLASKATGFPIAKIAAKLAVGMRLDEIDNEITQKTPSCFEPTIDYVVTKIPRFAFEKFNKESPSLGVQMKSIGEVMAIGRTMTESFQKAIRSLEVKKIGFDGIYFCYQKIKDLDKQALQKFIASENKDFNLKEKIISFLTSFHYQRFSYLKDAFFLGLTIEEIYQYTKIDYWFLHQLQKIFLLEKKFWNSDFEKITAQEMNELKQSGFCNEQLAIIFNCSIEKIEQRLERGKIYPCYKMVDTCAGEFESYTPYYYSTYDEETEYPLAEKKEDKEKIIIFGGGPNRIGQGIEFDYMCVQASFALKDIGFQTVIVNSNPETVSTDFNVSDVLFFEPLTKEDVMNIINVVQPKAVIVQLGGQTPLNLAEYLNQKEVPFLGTSYQSIANAEDREFFSKTLEKLQFKQPDSGIANTIEQAEEIINQIGLPVLVRPSFVLGGRAMKIIYQKEEVRQFVEEALNSSDKQNQCSVLIDKYLVNALELDVDLVSDGEEVVICGVMEHVERAGIHSGDSACFLPPQNVSEHHLKEIARQAKELAVEMKIVGFMNIQFAIKKEEIYFIEANPRGSRTIPFVSKVTGIPWVKIAVQIMSGMKIEEIDIPKHQFNHVAVKESVFPFNKFLKEDVVLGPEMKSTGEVMGISYSASEAFYKAMLGAGTPLPQKGNLLVSIPKKYRDEELLKICRRAVEIGFKLYATQGTSNFLKEAKIENQFIAKIGEGRPDVKDVILDNEIDLIFNAPSSSITSKEKGKEIRSLANRYKISLFTTLSIMKVCIQAIAENQHKEFKIQSMQEYYSEFEK